MPKTPVSAAATGLPASRRGFLRGLTTLPLIGGGVTLIGAPSAVAEPCTDTMMGAYVALLAHEHRAALVEHERRKLVGNSAEYVERVARHTYDSPHMFWFPQAPHVERVVGSAPPSTRAALVLAAVGCDWREGGR